MNMPLILKTPGEEGFWGCESWYTLLVFCFFLVKTCKEIIRICKIIHIESSSSQFYAIIIDYLLILAEVTPKQCRGAILTSKCF